VRFSAQSSASCLSRDEASSASLPAPNHSGGQVCRRQPPNRRRLLGVAEVDLLRAQSATMRIITPPSGWSALGLPDLWRSRELLYFFAWRDVKVRYAQALLGVAWALLQPLLMMAIFTVFLGRLAKVPSDGIPYPLFAMAGLLPWTFFANAVGSSTTSLVSSAALVSRVYFPRLLLPLGALLSWLPDLAMASLLLIAMLLVYGIAPPVTILLLPVLALSTLLAAASVGVFLSALNVAYRDVRYAMPFVVQLWLFATPVVYPASLVPDRVRLLFGLNPMTGVVEGFRWAFLRHDPPPWGLMGVSTLTSVGLLVAGTFYFRRVEHGFADLI
jgi:lipopolysaccharide transport system permease protein